jgi:hypothetical protein
LLTTRKSWFENYTTPLAENLFHPVKGQMILARMHCKSFQLNNAGLSGTLTSSYASYP